MRWIANCFHRSSFRRWAQRRSTTKQPVVKSVALLDDIGCERGAGSRQNIRAEGAVNRLRNFSPYLEHSTGDSNRDTHILRQDGETSDRNNFGRDRAVELVWLGVQSQLNILTRLQQARLGGGYIQPGLPLLAIGGQRKQRTTCRHDGARIDTDLDYCAVSRSKNLALTGNRDGTPLSFETLTLGVGLKAQNQAFQHRSFTQGNQLLQLQIQIDDAGLGTELLTLGDQMLSTDLRESVQGNAAMVGKMLEAINAFCE